MAQISVLYSATKIHSVVIVNGYCQEAVLGNKCPTIGSRRMKVIADVLWKPIGQPSHLLAVCLRSLLETLKVRMEAAKLAMQQKIADCFERMIHEVEKSFPWTARSWNSRSAIQNVFTTGIFLGAPYRSLN